MNYYSLELQKIRLRNDIKVCKDMRLKQLMIRDLHLIEQKQMELLKEKALKDEKTRSLI